MHAYKHSSHPTTDGCLLAQGAPSLPGTNRGMSAGAEEKETRTLRRTPGEEQQDGEEVEIQALSFLDYHGECALTSKQNG